MPHYDTVIAGSLISLQICQPIALSKTVEAKLILGGVMQLNMTPMYAHFIPP